MPDLSSASWHADPLGRFEQRYWDGQNWTAHVVDSDGAAALDELASARPENDVTSVQAGSALSSSPSTPTPSLHADAVMPPGGSFQAPSHQTPNFNLPGGGSWAAPQQLVVSNASKSPGLAIASLTLGIGAFFFSLIPLVGFLSIPFAITGLALGIAGYVRATKGFEGKGLSITGIVACVAALFVSAVYVAAVGETVKDIDNSVREANTDPVDFVCNPDRYWQDPDC